MRVDTARSRSDRVYGKRECVFEFLAVHTALIGLGVILLWGFYQYPFLSSSIDILFKIRTIQAVSYLCVCNIWWPNHRFTGFCHSKILDLVDIRFNSDLYTHLLRLWRIVKNIKQWIGQHRDHWIEVSRLKSMVCGKTFDNLH